MARKISRPAETAITHTEFWRRFVTDTGLTDASSRYRKTIRLGDTKAACDEAAQLIVSGMKTACSSLRAAYSAGGDDLPRVGALTIIEDGGGRPVAVVETTEVDVLAFCDIDDAFVRAYGEWGGSLKSWRRQCRANYSPRCRVLGTPFGESTELVCERFKVVFSPPKAGAGSRSGR